MESNERPHFVTAEAISSTPIEFFSLEKHRSNLILSSTTDLKDEVSNILRDIPGWLPIASEVLGISSNINDYILTPIISMPSDLPNRNGHAFPYTELTRWQPEYGSIMYKTWDKKPSFQNHNNQDPTVANGVIFSTLLRPMINTSGDIWKVIKLVGWDRKRDPVLANNILAKNINSYSMGAYAQDYACSICGGLATKGGCNHLTDPLKPDFKIVEGKLAYWNVVNAVGFEPARASCSTRLCEECVPSRCCSKDSQAGQPQVRHRRAIRRAVVIRSRRRPRP